MRQKLKSALQFDWSDTVGGYQDHVESVIAMGIKPDERREMCEMLHECEQEETIYTLTGVMYEEPDAAYWDALVRALDSPNKKKRFLAMRALIYGGYENALELLFNKPAVQEAMGDELPWNLWGHGERLTEAMQRNILGLFRKRFTPIPQLNMQARQWVRMLADLSVTDEQVVAILCRIWDGLGRQDSLNKLLVLEAMATNAHPKYEPAFRKAGKSSVKDLRDLGKAGLAVLAGDLKL